MIPFDRVPDAPRSGAEDGAVDPRQSTGLPVGVEVVSVTVPVSATPSR